MTIFISPQTEHLLQIEAQKRQMSPAQLAKQLIQTGLLTKKRDASQMAGKWSNEEADAFDERIASLQEVVDEQNLELKIQLENSRGFDVFSGLWTQQEADEFAANTKEFSQIDEESWRETHPHRSS
jgi:hypothetical protein